MCRACCQTPELGRGQVDCGNMHRAGVDGMVGGCEHSGGYDTGKTNGRPKLAGDDRNETK